jgi:steroid delta-isomerase-like uncharacterized protein
MAEAGACRDDITRKAVEGEDDMSSEESKELVLRWFAELDRGNLDVVDELIAADYVDHNPALPNLPRGREGVRQYVRILKTAFPDAVHIIDDVIAEDNKVMTRVTARGTFLGDCIGYHPTGRVVEISGIAVHRIENGRLIEHWAHADMAGFMHQLGATTDPVA